MDKHHNKLVVIVGPTASGKSSLAMKLTDEFNGEIVAADSRQIYQEMDIGTAKDKGVYMVDVVSPDQTLTVAQYKEKALSCIDGIVEQDKLPFLVGGTGLYIQTIVDNLKIPQVPPNKALRKRLRKKSIKDLFKTLKGLAPERAKGMNKSDRQNKRRLIRALEIAFSGKGFGTKGEPLFDCLQIGVKREKKELYQRINKRVDQMIEEGLVEEVKKLSQKYDWGLPSMSAIGYQEFREHFAGKQTLEKTIRLIKTHTRQFARKQISWFKRDKRIIWIDAYQQAKKLIEDFL